MVDTLPHQLHLIDLDVAQHRRLYLAALNAGHDGECVWHESELDRLLDLRLHLALHGPLTLQ